MDDEMAELNEAFSAADSVLARASGLARSASVASQAREARAQAALGGSEAALSEERVHMAAEEAFLSALPGLRAELSDALEAAVPFMGGPEEAKRRHGLMSMLSPSRRERGEEPGRVAQAAFAGRRKRLSDMEALVSAAAKAAFLARRDCLKAAFSFREKAVSAMRGADRDGEGGYPSDDSVRRALVAAEEAASLYGGHADALALLAREATATEREPDGAPAMLPAPGAVTLPAPPA